MNRNLVEGPELDCGGDRVLKLAGCQQIPLTSSVTHMALSVPWFSHLYIGLH